MRKKQELEAQGAKLKDRDGLQSLSPESGNRFRDNDMRKKQELEAQGAKLKDRDALQSLSPESGNRFRDNGMRKKQELEAQGASSGRLLAIYSKTMAGPPEPALFSSCRRCQTFAAMSR